MSHSSLKSTSTSTSTSSGRKTAARRRGKKLHCQKFSWVLIIQLIGSLAVFVPILLVAMAAGKVSVSWLQEEAEEVQQGQQGQQQFLFSNSSSQIQSISIIENINNPTRNIPNVLFIGAQKAGTTALSQYLFENVNVCCSDVNNIVSTTDSSTNFQNPKETHFFDLYFHRGLTYYQQLYQHCRNDKSSSTTTSIIIMDATPNHMRYPDRVKQLYQQHGSLSKLKIFMVLREPVQREISAYKHRVHFYKNDPAAIAATEDTVIDEEDGSIMTFEKAMELQVIPEINGTTSISNLRGRSFYAYWIRRWFELFDRKNILVLSYDEVKANSDEAVRRLLHFLGLPEQKESIIELE